MAWRCESGSLPCLRVGAYLVLMMHRLLQVKQTQNDAHDICVLSDAVLTSSWPYIPLDSLISLLVKWHAQQANCISIFQHLHFWQKRFWSKPSEHFCALTLPILNNYCKFCSQSSEQWNQGLGKKTMFIPPLPVFFFQVEHPLNAVVKLRPVGMKSAHPTGWVSAEKPRVLLRVFAVALLSVLVADAR